MGSKLLANKRKKVLQIKTGLNKAASGHNLILVLGFFETQ